MKIEEIVEKGMDGRGHRGKKTQGDCDPLNQPSRAPRGSQIIKRKTRGLHEVLCTSAVTVSLVF